MRTLDLEMEKEIVGSSTGLRETRVRTLWKDRPPTKQERLLAAYELET
jgi:hypothetical protein